MDDDENFEFHINKNETFLKESRKAEKEEKGFFKRRRRSRSLSRNSSEKMKNNETMQTKSTQTEIPDFRNQKVYIKEDYYKPVNQETESNKLIKYVCPHCGIYITKGFANLKQHLSSCNEGIKKKQISTKINPVYFNNEDKNISYFDNNYQTHETIHLDSYPENPIESEKEKTPSITNQDEEKRVKENFQILKKKIKLSLNMTRTVLKEEELKNLRKIYKETGKLQQTEMLMPPFPKSDLITTIKQVKNGENVQERLKLYITSKFSKKVAEFIDENPQELYIVTNTKDSRLAYNCLLYILSASFSAIYLHRNDTPTYAEGSSTANFRNPTKYEKEVVEKCLTNREDLLSAENIEKWKTLRNKSKKFNKGKYKKKEQTKLKLSSKLSEKKKLQKVVKKKSDKRKEKEEELKQENGYLQVSKKKIQKKLKNLKEKTKKETTIVIKQRIIMNHLLKSFATKIQILQMKIDPEYCEDIDIKVESDTENNISREEISTMMNTILYPGPGPTPSTSNAESSTDSESDNSEESDDNSDSEDDQSNTESEGVN